MRVSWCLETSSIKTPFPGWVSVPSSFVSLFIFYILSYLLLKTMGCFSGQLMSSASDQKLFCDICSAFNCSFNESVGEKVVSPSYSSTILAPPLVYFLNNCFHIKQYVCACSVASVIYNSLPPYGLYSARLLCSWDSPGKNTGVVEKELATYSNIFAWRIPGTEELGKLPSMGSQESDMTEAT